MCLAASGAPAAMKCIAKELVNKVKILPALLKCQLTSIGLHSIISQKMELFRFT
jgi:hypothetical protein